MRQFFKIENDQKPLQVGVIYDSGVKGVKGKRRHVTNHPERVT